MSLSQSILKTLHYHNIFDYPLSKSEIYKFLIQFSSTKPIFAKTLKKLVSKKAIFFKKPFYFLPQRGSILETRKNREKISSEKISIAKKTAKILKLIPWVQAIAITGALAMKNSEKQDDIDFLIITSENRLWLTRLLAILVLQILGRRRKPGDKNVKNKICTNMFLDKSALKIFKDKQNLFTSHEITQAKLILQKDYAWEMFLNENKWVKVFLPNSFVLDKASLRKYKKARSKTFIILDYLETIIFKLQFKIMETKKTREQISKNFAFFHPQDRGKEIIAKFNKFSV
ncbi:hypothetical protein ACFLZ1_00940 [Patescibacteria group bacterium]